MPIATPEIYADMLDRAKAGGFAYPAINVTSSETVNAALRGFADAGSDGIIQFSTGGAEFASGTSVKEMVTGAVALAEFAHVVAAKYSINVALHTDHCQKDKLDTYVRPLIAISQDRVNAGREPLFQSHMWDGSAIEMEENLQIAAELLAKASAAKIILELEIGVVGGEEDGVVGELNEKLYTTPEDALRTAEVLGTGENGRYLLAATFGNVHGVYKPGNVKLRPEILDELQKAVGAETSKDKPFDLVFHGGSGSLLEEIREALSYGVVKMNVDTDTQYAFTRPIAGHMFTNYDGVLKVDGEVGNKKAYDPRPYLKLAEVGMAARVQRACEDLLSAGTARRHSWFSVINRQLRSNHRPEPGTLDHGGSGGEDVIVDAVRVNLALRRAAQGHERRDPTRRDEHARHQQPGAVPGEERVDGVVSAAGRSTGAGGQDRPDDSDAQQARDLARCVEDAARHACRVDRHRPENHRGQRHRQAATNADQREAGHQ